LGCDFNDYYQTPITYISEIIETIYPFVKRKGVKFQPWVSDLEGHGLRRDMSISGFEVECRQKLSEGQEEVIKLVVEELLEIFGKLGVEMIAILDELMEEEQEKYGGGYVKIVEVA
jgi:hypothetical protein